MSDAPDNDYGLGLKVHEDAYRELERERDEAREQRDRLADIVIRIGWPARGTADDIATVGDFAAEIQATWKYEELEALQSQALAAVKGGSDE